MGCSFKMTDPSYHYFMGHSSSYTPAWFSGPMETVKGAHQAVSDVMRYAEYYCKQSGSPVCRKQTFTTSELLEWSVWEKGSYSLTTHPECKNRWQYICDVVSSKLRTVWTAVDFYFLLMDLTRKSDWPED